MDPTKDKTDQATVPNNQNAVPPAPPVPPPPVGALAKEAEPLPQNLVSPPERGPEISAELKEIGVREVSPVPQLAQQQREVGIKVSDRPPVEQATASSSPSFKSPLTQEEMVTAKRSKISDAIAWLANAIVRQIKRAKFNERESLPKPL